MEDQQANSWIFTNFTTKNWRFHGKTLHAGVQATICGIREDFWVPKSRSAVKSIIYNCNLCKRYRKGPLKPPSNGRFAKISQ